MRNISRIMFARNISRIILGLVALFLVAIAVRHEMQKPVAIPDLKEADIQALLMKSTKEDGFEETLAVDPGVGIQIAELDGNPGKDAVAVSVMNSGGTGTWHSLQVFVNRNGVPFQLDSYDFGDRQGPESISIGTDGIITATGVTDGPNDPLCCASRATVWHFKIADGKIVKIDETYPASPEASQN